MKINSFLVGQPTNKKIVQEVLDDLMKFTNLMLKEQRAQRQDLKDIKLMINKLLIDEHLQQQVDTFFEDESQTNKDVLAEEEERHELEDK